MKREESPPVPDQVRARFWGIASSPDVAKRAFGYMLVVGGILIGINHGDAIVRGDFDFVRIVKMLITPIVPYVVSTLSSVSAIKAASEAQRSSAHLATSGNQS